MARKYKLTTSDTYKNNKSSNSATARRRGKGYGGGQFA